MKKILLKIAIPASISAIMLFVAVASLPYDYYILLRWVVSVCGAIICYHAYEQENTTWAIVMGAIVLLFNPLFPAHLTKEIWIPIDIISGILFIASIFTLRQKS